MYWPSSSVNLNVPFLPRTGMGGVSERERGSGIPENDVVSSCSWSECSLFIAIATLFRVLRGVGGSVYMSESASASEDIDRPIRFELDESAGC